MMHIIYHGNCFDGFTAAWVAAEKHPDAVLLPGVHGQDIPSVPAGAQVVMVDISYPRPMMDALREALVTTGGSLTVLDHHATAKVALEGFPGATFDMHRSGAQLAWDYFNPLDKGQYPLLVAYVADRDLWKFELPESRTINALIGASQRNLAAWHDLDQFLFHHAADAVQLGGAILRRDETLVAQMIENVIFYDIAGHRVPVVNASVLFGEIGEALLRAHPEAQIAGYYFNRGDGFQQWGLRSRSGVDCSATAKVFGGGGHPQASGFQFQTKDLLSSVPFIPVA